MIEIYIAAESKTCKNILSVKEDFEARLKRAIISEFRSGMPRRVSVVSASEHKHELIDEFNDFIESGEVQTDCHLIKLKVVVSPEFIYE